MIFYTYHQNNSGGVFDFDADAGITKYVIIEATSPADADNKFQRIGGYFNGCEYGRDCDCCGDRWSTASAHDAEVEPLVYGETMDKCKHSGWIDGPEIAVHYADGSVSWFACETPKKE